MLFQTMVSNHPLSSTVLTAAALAMAWLSARFFFSVVGILSRIQLGVAQDGVLLAFFHPYCYSGGGGERVLWQGIHALLNDAECRISSKNNAGDSSSLVIGEEKLHIVIYCSERSGGKARV